MRFYLDEHLPLGEVSRRLRRKGHSCTHAIQLGFRGRDDHFHYQFARAEKRVLLTQDMALPILAGIPIENTPV